MGSPPYPTAAQLKALRKAAEIPAPEVQKLNRGALTVTIPPDGLALIELRK
jgi:xylan 1,4-beta-xylosidase